MTAYYNEHDKFAAAWLRELIADGLIAPGDVDERDIQDVTPADLVGYTQCHFFAGIGVWSLALRLAGWPDDRPIWTGSCPCQPFSAAGKGTGFADERHLWPAFHWLIGQCRPTVIVGEQVSSADGLAWLDLVLADLDQEGYTGGAVDTCAAGFGAPHIRQRLYWVGYATAERSQRSPRRGGIGERIVRGESTDRRISSRVGHLYGERLSQRIGDGEIQREAMGAHARQAAIGRGDSSGLGYANGGERGQGIAAPEFAKTAIAVAGKHDWLADAECWPAERHGLAVAGTTRGSEGEGDQRQRLRDDDRHGGEPMRPGPVNGLWHDAEWLYCRDDKYRPAKPGAFPLVAARTFRNRVGALRGAGNAINVAQAEGFIRAVMETTCNH